MERDLRGSSGLAGNAPISTHTLTWSVTKSGKEFGRNGTISTHTLTWSVTIPALANLIVLLNFNSHAHVERDLNQAEITKVKYISTHTLTWSVTGRIACMLNFNVISTHTLTWSVT